MPTFSSSHAPWDSRGVASVRPARSVAGRGSSNPGDSRKAPPEASVKFPSQLPRYRARLRRYARHERVSGSFVALAEFCEANPGLLRAEAVRRFVPSSGRGVRTHALASDLEARGVEQHAVPAAIERGRQGEEGGLERDFHVFRGPEALVKTPPRHRFTLVRSSGGGSR